MKKLKSKGAVIAEGKEQMELFRQDGGPAEQQSKKENEEAKAVLPESERLEANNVRSVTPAESRAHAQRMTSDQLSDYLVKNGLGEALAKLVQLKPYVQEMWVRFEHLKPSETIAGCRTKEEYCTKILNRTPRAVQYLLYGRTPKRPDGAHSGKRPKSSNSKTALARTSNQAALSQEPINERNHGELPCATKPTAAEVRKRVCQAYAKMTRSSRIDDIQKFVEHIESVNPGFSSRMSAFICMESNDDRSDEFEKMTVHDILVHTSLATEDFELEAECPDEVTDDCEEAIGAIARKHNLTIPAAWACMVESIAIDIKDSLQESIDFRE